MITQHRATGRASSIPAGLAVGAAVSILVTTVICMIGGWMIGAEIISQDKVGYCSITALLASAIIGSTTAWKKIKRHRLAVSLAAAGIYYAILVAITFVFFDGKFQGLGVTLITILLGALASVLITNGGQGRKNSPSRKKYIGKMYKITR